jgi:hypothetical protein
MKFHYELKPSWPALAWLAQGKKSDGVATIYHGSGVEITQDWFCEAVWDGEFERGEFDLTDVIAGSGARIRDGEIVFVASGNSVDRLQWFNDGSTLYVSNSLSCLMAQLNASVDPSYPHYIKDARSVIKGLDRYKSTLATNRGDIQLLYFHNLVWDESGVHQRKKPGLGRDFSSFEKYREFLQRSMAALMTNLHAKERHFLFKPMGTLSSGYDSTTVAVLGQQYGLEEVITFQQSQSGDNDGGIENAQRLGLRAHIIDRQGWRRAKYPEVPFMASYSSATDVVFLGADHHLRGRVLFTGYHGDKVWDKLTTYLSDQIMRGDPSGLALTDYRLEAGFINCAIPFLGTRQVRDIHRISNSEVMKPWDVSGNYSRPICRRIAEEAGLPRDSFGQKKKAASMDPFAGWEVQHGDGSFLAPESRDDFLDWIRRHRSAWTKRGAIAPIASMKVNYWVNALFSSGVDFNHWITERTPLWRVLGYPSYQPHYLNLYLFPWAIDRMKRRYQD